MEFLHHCEPQSTWRTYHIRLAATSSHLENRQNLSDKFIAMHFYARARASLPNCQFDGRSARQLMHKLDRGLSAEFVYSTVGMPAHTVAKANELDWC